MSRGYLVLDIETVPDPILPWDAAKDGFPPPTHHQVIALGVLWLDEEYRFRRMGVFGETNTTEDRVLEDFAKFVGKERPRFVTFNGRAFDLPVLVCRCLKHGVSFGSYYGERDYRYRYGDLHIDLAEHLTDYGAARRPRLDHLAQLIGLPGKLDIDGSMVQSLYEKGQLATIRDYCLHDVAQTAFLLLRFELLRGRLDLEGYRARASELWDALAPDPRTLAIFERADKNRVVITRA